MFCYIKIHEGSTSTLLKSFFLQAEITVINKMITHFTRQSGIMVNYFRKLVNEFLITSPQQFENQS